MLLKRSFSLSGHRTSVALEPEFWHVLEHLAAREQIPLSAFISRIDSGRTPDTPLASSLRVLALKAAQSLSAAT